MEKNSQDKSNGRTAHSNVRKGLSDYNDGENVTHYLGNDDYEEGNNLADKNEVKNNPKLDGKVAGGNEHIDDDSDLTASPAEKANGKNTNH